MNTGLKAQPSLPETHVGQVMNLDFLHHHLMKLDCANRTCAGLCHRSRLSRYIYLGLDDDKLNCTYIHLYMLDLVR